jgi:hypothetical protein
MYALSWRRNEGARPSKRGNLVVILIIDCALLALAGILFNMSLLHFFSFAETRNHPVIAQASWPHLASALWASLQLVLGLTILLVLRYRFELNVGTLCLFSGFALWGIAIGYFYDRKRREPGVAT